MSGEGAHKKHEEHAEIERNYVGDESVLEKLRDRGGAAIFNEFVETWAYSFHSPLYDELVDGCPGFDQLRNPKPLHITASVKVSAGDGAPQVIDLNALAQQKYAKVLCSPSSAQQPSSSMQPQRRSGMRGGLDAGGFYYPIEVSDGDKKGIALLHLRYYPIKALEETLPEGCEPGFDVRWQGRKLTDEKMRLLRFMDPGRGGLSAAGRGGPRAPSGSARV